MVTSNLQPIELCDQRYLHCPLVTNRPAEINWIQMVALDKPAGNATAHIELRDGNTNRVILCLNLKLIIV